MTARNCWTCQHDEAHRSDGDDYVFHVCRVARYPLLKRWIDLHVVPDSPGVPPSMPPRDAPPCPAWSPLDGRKGAE
jgi:hypothetical protein